MSCEGLETLHQHAVDISHLAQWLILLPESQEWKRLEELLTRRLEAATG